MANHKPPNALDFSAISGKFDLQRAHAGVFRFAAGHSEYLFSQ